MNRTPQRDEEEALEAALKQLDWRTRRAEQTPDQALDEVRAILNLTFLRMYEKFEEIIRLM